MEEVYIYYFIIIGSFSTIQSLSSILFRQLMLWYNVLKKSYQVIINTYYQKWKLFIGEFFMYTHTHTIRFMKITQWWIESSLGAWLASNVTLYRIFVIFLGFLFGKPKQS